MYPVNKETFVSPKLIKDIDTRLQSFMASLKVSHDELRVDQEDSLLKYEELHDFRFYDASLVLLCGSKVYKVHKSVIRDSSNILSLPVIKNHNVYGDLMVIIIPVSTEDDRKDFYRFMRSIYYGSEFLPLRYTAESFDDLGGILRVADRFQASSHVEAIVDCIESVYTRNFWAVRHDMGVPIPPLSKTILLAENLSLHYILRACYYDAAFRYPDQLSDLPARIRQDIAKGKASITSCERIFRSFPCADVDDCNDDRCRGGVGRLISNPCIGRDPLHDFLTFYHQDDVPNLCPGCEIRVRSWGWNYWETVWENMFDYFAIKRRKVGI